MEVEHIRPPWFLGSWKKVTDEDLVLSAKSSISLEKIRNNYHSDINE